MCTEARVLQNLQARYPDYDIGRLIIGERERWFAYRLRGKGPHTIITDDPAEIVEHLGP
jgi:hypothetical protein